MRAIPITLFVVLAAALVLTGCTPKKSAFPGEGAVPAPAPAPAPSAGSDTPQPIGSEGFRENALDSSAGTAAGAGEMQRPIGEDDAAAALRPVYFDYDSEQLSAAALATLDANAAWLRANTGVKVQIEGHCDERGTIEYNLALGQRRARSVFDHLVRLGVPAGRLDTISFGKERPAVAGIDAESWARNRRAEFRALAE
jgi:peptidoglycan-associated lipoprotein